MTPLAGLSPLNGDSRQPVSAGWRLCFYFFLLCELRPNWIAFSTREAIITTTEIISKSDMISPPLLLLSIRGEKPSAIVSFLPGSLAAPRILYHADRVPVNLRFSAEMSIYPVCHKNGPLSRSSFGRRTGALRAWTRRTAAKRQGAIIFVMPHK